MNRHSDRNGPLADMVLRRQTDLAFHRDSNVLVYLIHGITGTPVEMSYLARKLSRKIGWDVYATTLPGHCTRLRDLVQTTEKDWRTHVEKQLLFARDRYEHVYVAGLSAGALLALHASTVVPVDGVGVMSPTFFYDGWNTPWSHAVLPLAMKVVPLPLQRFLFHIDGPPFGIKDEMLQASVRKSYRLTTILGEWIAEWRALRRGRRTAPQPFMAASKGYPIFPLRTLTEIHRLIGRVRTRLCDVTAPTVILQALEDDMTSPRNASVVYDEIASTNKKVVLLDDCYHVITVDKRREAVTEELSTFFRVCAAEKHGHDHLQTAT